MDIIIFITARGYIQLLPFTRYRRVLPKYMLHGDTVIYS